MILREFEGGFEQPNINQAVKPALHSLINHEEEYIDLVLDAVQPYGLLWTFAGALLQPNEEGEVLLQTLQQHLDNPEHESWQRLLDLNGIVSRIITTLPETDNKSESHN